MNFELEKLHVSVSSSTSIIGSCFSLQTVKFKDKSLPRSGKWLCKVGVMEKIWLWGHLISFCVMLLNIIVLITF